jgi:hypothetical protein
MEVKVEELHPEVTPGDLEQGEGTIENPVTASDIPCLRFLEADLGHWLTAWGCLLE